LAVFLVLQNNTKM